VALVVFARWEPLACIGAALLFGAAGALGPSLQTVGVSQGYYLFNAAPYVLTLVLMFFAVAPGRRMRGAPGELSIVR
jgi:simple sugar transport system permease protein